MGLSARHMLGPGNLKVSTTGPQSRRPEGRDSVQIDNNSKVVQMIGTECVKETGEAQNDQFHQGGAQVGNSSG